jgi:transposase InsO family protein
MTVLSPSGPTMYGRWNEEEEKTIRGIVFPTNGHDQLATGKKLRVLTAVDTFSRYVPVLDMRSSDRGEDVVATLERVCRTAGYPARCCHSTTRPSGQGSRCERQQGWHIHSERAASVSFHAEWRPADTIGCLPPIGDEGLRIR